MKNITMNYKYELQPGAREPARAVGSQWSVPMSVSTPARDCPLPDRPLPCSCSCRKAHDPRHDTALETCTCDPTVTQHNTEQTAQLKEEVKKNKHDETLDVSS